MITKEFFEVLKSNTDKKLVFEYELGTYVPKSYHITEVKNVHVDSVDCGGRADSYKETIIQLWVDPQEEVKDYLTIETALKIFSIVDSKTKINLDTPVFFEWGLGDLRKSTYAVEGIETLDDQIVVKLFVQPTVCKPKFELQIQGGESCGPGCC